MSDQVTMSEDWRSGLLAGVPLRAEGEPVNRLGWPGYDARPAVTWGAGPVAGHRVVAAVWDFRVYGGSFGERDATAFAAAADAAVAGGLPLVSFLRSGGTRLQEGVGGLVGLARATLAVRRLAAAGVPHLAVVDRPTTGGVWMTVGSRADLRCGVAGATVGFAGPRVAEAMTGEPLPVGSHTVASAHENGLVDALVDGDGVGGWLAATLGAFTSSGGTGPAGDTGHPDTARTGWEQVLAARTGPRPAGRDLLADLLPSGVVLRGADDTVAVRLGPFAGGPVAVGAAVAADRSGRPTPAGYRLLTRAARLADRFDLPLVTLVDTPGAEPGAAAEAAGQAAAIGDAMDAVLGCRAPTLAVVTGEGGSGGALAATCADRVLVAPDAYMTALAPEGAATTLRVSPREAADRGGVRPVDLLALGFADGLTPAPGTAAFGPAVRSAIESLTSTDRTGRGRERERRWAAPLGGSTS